MTTPLSTEELLFALRALAGGQEYAERGLTERAVIDQAAAAVRAGDPRVLAMLRHAASLSTMDSVALRLGVPGTSDMRTRGLAEALELAVTRPDPAAAPPADTGELAAAVQALPLPEGAGRWTCRTVTTAWLGSRRSAHTRRAYFRDLAGWLSWLDTRGLDPREARRGDVDTWLAELAATGRPPAASTINRRLSTLSSWYAYLIDHDLMTRNPVTAVDRPALDRDYSPTVGLTVAEVRALLRAADAEAQRRTSAGLGTRDAAERDRVLIGLLAGLGLRVSEATGLDLGDLRINQGHRTAVIHGKSGRTRELPVPAALARHLEPLLTQRRRDVAHERTSAQFAPLIERDMHQVRRQLAAGILPPRVAGRSVSLDDVRRQVESGWSYPAPASAAWRLADQAIGRLSPEELERRRDTGWLFVTGTGKRLSQAYVYAVLRRLAHAAGLSAAARISPHSLRRSAATAALDDGAPLPDVQDFLGHADPRTTRRYDRNRGSLDHSPTHRLGVLYAE